MSYPVHGQVCLDGVNEIQGDLFCCPSIVSGAGIHTNVNVKVLCFVMHAMINCCEMLMTPLNIKLRYTLQIYIYIFTCSKSQK